DAQWRLLKKSDFQNRTPKKREILRYMVSKCSEYAEFCGKNFYKGTFSAASAQCAPLRMVQ
ncbi:MAG: hypothetical protein J6K89_09285, partial [Oscillospiraceae bacterium]|nr:hypothetical protein [Oscillospiraceae bacterium]